MDDLTVRVAHYAAEHQLWSAGATLVVAVSGGPDSLCLLHVLRRLAERSQLRLHIAHLDHGLRPDSAADARFVTEISQAWDIPITVDTADVHASVSLYGGIEAAARALRYRLLRTTALAVGASAVVTGHTADDQAETVLMRLLRGAGPTGLAGMRPRLNFEQWRQIGSADDAREQGTDGPALVRPLLDVRRSEIEAYCAKHHLEPCIDSSNASDDYLRNRVRAYIIPSLESYNSRIVGALGRTARVCADEDALLVDLLDQLWPNLALVETEQIRLRRDLLMSSHRALRRRALRRAVTTLAPGIEIAGDHLDRMLRLIERTQGRLQLPGGLWIYAGKKTIDIRRMLGN